MLVPENIEELSDLLKKANSEKLPVTISGGGTSTTGSRVPFGGVVVSMEKFNKIFKVSKRDMSATLGSGVLVDELKKAADKEGLFYTCHPTESSAFVGGTVATNASGARSFKYGPTRNYVKRLKMVLAGGGIMDLRRGEVFLSHKNSKIKMPDGREMVVPLPHYRTPDVKCSSGYFIRDGMDLIDLFIGQEGTLSVIVEIELALVKKPHKILSSFVFFDSEEDAWKFAFEARDISKRNRISPGGSMLDALSIEYFSSNALAFLRDAKANVPLSARSAIFFEQETSPGGAEDKVLNEWLDLIGKHGALLDDTWVAMNEKEAEKFAGFRYSIPESVNDIVRKSGFHKFSTDIAVPDDKALEMMEFYAGILRPQKLRHVIFGHIGESHVHANILPSSEEESISAGEMVLKFVRKGVSMGGVVSAEHGIGKIKHRYLEEMYGTSGVLEMSKIKKAFDPNCILGLGNIFPGMLLK